MATRKRFDPRSALPGSPFFGNRIGYTELREACSASAAQVVRRERADAMFRKGFQVQGD
jgi:3-hydroxyacyl-CoA dehydrogenase